MGIDIKRIADDEWESGNPIDFRGRQAKNNYAQRAWSDWNDDSYLALGLDAMRETGDKSGQYARYNAGTDNRKALDIAHLNLDDYYGSHITGAGLPNKGTAYTYDASALKVLPKDIGKLSTNEQMDTPAQTRANYKTQRRSMGLPDIIPTVTQPTEAPHEVEQEQDAPEDLSAKPKDSEADVQAQRMAEASKVAHKGVVGVSASGAGDAGGTVQFEKEKDDYKVSRDKRLNKLETASGRTIETLVTVKKGTPASEKARAIEMASGKKKDLEEEKEGEEEEREGEGEGEGEGEEKEKKVRSKLGFKVGFKWNTRKEELEKAFPGIQNLRKTKHGEVSYNNLSTGQKKFMVAIAQGKPGKPSDDLMMNYRADQGTDTEKQHDYMMKMIDAHDKKEGKKGLTGWAINLLEVADEIPSLSLGKLFSLSPEGRDIVYQSTRSMGESAWKPKLRSLTDHDLDVLLDLYGRVKLIGGTRGEKYTASMVKKNAEAEGDAEGDKLLQRTRRLRAKGYEK